MRPDKGRVVREGVAGGRRHRLPAYGEPGGKHLGLRGPAGAKVLDSVQSGGVGIGRSPGALEPRAAAMPRRGYSIASSQPPEVVAVDWPRVALGRPTPIHAFYGSSRPRTPRASGGFSMNHFVMKTSLPSVHQPSCQLPSSSKKNAALRMAGMKPRSS